MQSHSVSSPTAAVSALVQQLLLAQGGRYASVIDEGHWKRVAVLMQIPDRGGEGRLPAGDYLVLPWDVAGAEQLRAYLERLWNAGVEPAHVVVVTALPTFGWETLADLGQAFGTRVAAVYVANGSVAAPPNLRTPLARVFEPGAARTLAAFNPLEHMTILADPRDPQVFFERLRRASPRAPLTRVLIAVNALIFGLTMLDGDGSLFAEIDIRTLIDWGANAAALTIGRGELWRLLACTFLHAGLLHIGFNMYALKILGDTAERLFGTPMFGALYLLCAIGGSVASLGFTLRGHAGATSVGASGAVFGIMGGLLGFALSRRGSVPPRVFRGLTRSALLFITVNIAFGLAVSVIDNAAHLGGLGAGLVAGALLSRDLPPAPQPSRGRRGLAIGAMSLAVIVTYFLATSGYGTGPVQAGM